MFGHPAERLPLGSVSLCRQSITLVLCNLTVFNLLDLFSRSVSSTKVGQTFDVSFGRVCVVFMWFYLV